jgi:hypothetical protein
MKHGNDEEEDIPTAVLLLDDELEDDPDEAD